MQDFIDQQIDEYKDQLKHLKHEMVEAINTITHNKAEAESLRKAV